MLLLLDVRIVAVASLYAWLKGSHLVVVHMRGGRHCLVSLLYDAPSPVYTADGLPETVNVRDSGCCCGSIVDLNSSMSRVGPNALIPIVGGLTHLEPQSRFGGKLLEI